MASIRLYIRTKPKSDKDVTLYMQLRHTGVNINLNSGVSVPYRLWDKDKGKIKAYYSEPSDLVARMDRAKESLNDIEHKLFNAFDANPKLTTIQATNLIKSYHENKKQTKVDLPRDMNSYIEHLIEGMKSGSLKASNSKNIKNYAESTIKSWNSFIKTWKAFQKEYIKYNLSFSDINLNIHSKFIDYCYSIPYTADTTRKYLTTLKAVLSYGYRDKVSDNPIHLDNRFSKHVENSKGLRVYLSQAQIQSLYDLELTTEMEKKVRDLFLIGCYTGQRVSDYTRIKEEDIYQTPAGHKIINFTQQKTGTRVPVPILNPNLISILERWDYKLPKVSDVLINRHIKDICKQAGITEPFRTENMIGGKLIKETHPKYSLVTTHTARRSAITNWYLGRKLDLNQIRFLSGHKTDASFQKYICLSSDEIAEQIAETLSKE